MPHQAVAPKKEEKIKAEPTTWAGMLKQTLGKESSSAHSSEQGPTTPPTRAAKRKEYPQSARQSQQSLIGSRTTYLIMTLTSVNSEHSLSDVTPDEGSPDVNIEHDTFVERKATARKVRIAARSRHAGGQKRLKNLESSMAVLQTQLMNLTSTLNTRMMSAGSASTPLRGSVVWPDGVELPSLEGRTVPGDGSCHATDC